jgi:DDE superfamily endonuclease
MQLLPQFLTLLQQWRTCFADYRTHQRAVRFALALLVCLGRRTISRAICAQLRQFGSWAADYKLFSLSRWSPTSLFDVVLKLALPLMSKTQPLVIGLDDTITRKTGRRIPNASTLRDPLSPPYNTNLVWALRFIQAVLLIWPADGVGAARAIPIAFHLAPPVRKPRKKNKGFAHVFVGNQHDGNRCSENHEDHHRSGMESVLPKAPATGPQRPGRRIDSANPFALGSDDRLCGTHLVGRCR